MLTSTQCLEKAAQMQAHALSCRDPATSLMFAEIAAQWRTNAVVASHQDAWTDQYLLD